jgi:hypothetical protein
VHWFRHCCSVQIDLSVSVLCKFAVQHARCKLVYLLKRGMLVSTHLIRIPIGWFLCMHPFDPVFQSRLGTKPHLFDSFSSLTGRPRPSASSGATTAAPAQSSPRQYCSVPRVSRCGKSALGEKSLTFFFPFSENSRICVNLAKILSFKL